MGLSLQRELAGPEKYVNGHTVVRTGQQVRAFRIRKSSLQPTSALALPRDKPERCCWPRGPQCSRLERRDCVCVTCPLRSAMPSRVGTPIFSCAAPHRPRARNRWPVSWSSECPPTSRHAFHTGPEPPQTPTLTRQALPGLRTLAAGKITRRRPSHTHTRSRT